MVDRSGEQQGKRRSRWPARLARSSKPVHLRCGEPAGLTALWWHRTTSSRTTERAGPPTDRECDAFRHAVTAPSRFRHFTGWANCAMARWRNRPAHVGNRPWRTAALESQASPCNDTAFIPVARASSRSRLDRHNRHSDNSPCLKVGRLGTPGGSMGTSKAEWGAGGI